MVECIRCGVYCRDDHWLGKWCQECWEVIAWEDPSIGPVVHWEYEPLVCLEERRRQFMKDYLAGWPAMLPGEVIVL